MHKPISEGECLFVRQGCETGIREDGRGIRDHRLVTVETEILPHLNGSSRVRIANLIDVLCSIKAEVMELSINSLPKGIIDVSAEFSPSCNLKLDERRLVDIGSHLAQQLQRVISGSLDKSLYGLCIIPGKFCWCLHIDLLITRLNGDPLDACSMAIYSALKCTKIPKIELLTGPSGIAEDFEVIGDIVSAIDFPTDCVPICTTFAKVGNVFVIDASMSEHACASIAMTIAVDRHGKCCGMFKLHGGGTMTEQEIIAIFSDSKDFTPTIFKVIDTHMELLQIENNMAFSNTRSCGLTV